MSVPETAHLGWGALAVFFFTVGLVWLALRHTPAEADHWIRVEAGPRHVEYRCVYCRQNGVIQLPAPRDYCVKFDAAFRLLHQRCPK